MEILLKKFLLITNILTDSLLSCFLSLSERVLKELTPPSPQRERGGVWVHTQFLYVGEGSQSVCGAVCERNGAQHGYEVSREL